MTSWQRPYRGSFGLGFQVPPTVKALLLINTGVLLLKWILGAMNPEAEIGFLETFGLVPSLALGHLQLWQFVTYTFLHGGLWHLAFNMFALWMFGSEIETVWGRRIFLQYYFFCGLGGGLVYTLTALHSHIPLVGASGAIFGLLLAYGLMFPNRQILLYFLIPIKAKYFVLLLGFIELIASRQSRADGIGHYAHLGGMLFGYLYLQLGVAHSRPLQSLGGLRSWYARQRSKTRIRIVRPDAAKHDRPIEQERIDEILEKISREGLGSLTADEQEILRRASRRH